MAQRSNAYRTWSGSAFEHMKRGDVIFFSTTKGLTDAKGKKKVHHVGIISKVNKCGSTVEVVEGNTSSDKVMKRIYYVIPSSGKITNYSGHFFCGYISVK